MANYNPEIMKMAELPTASPGGRLVSFDKFDNFFDDFLLRKWPRLLDWSFPFSLDQGFPRIDVIEHDNEIEVQAALPGVKKEDLNVSISRQNVTISASIKRENREEGKYYRREITRDDFERTFSLPSEIDDDSAKASFNDGILKLVIQKTAAGKTKSIPIR